MSMNFMFDSAKLKNAATSQYIRHYALYITRAMYGLIAREVSLIDELAGALLWYIYICIHGQTIWSRMGPPPVNAQM